MKIINREMGGGKTTALVQIMMRPGNEDVIYVAPTLSQAHRIAYPYARQIDPNVDLNRFVSVAGLLEFDPESRPRFVIDELEGLLGSLAGGEVLAVAGTDEDLRRGQMAKMRGEY